MTRRFTWLSLLLGLGVIGTVGYAVYQQPANPQPLGTATVEVVGASKTAFGGTVGTVTDERHVKGVAPLELEVPYKQADYVVATIQQQGPGELSARIRVKRETVDEGQTSAAGERVVLMWKAPRQDSP